VAEQLVPLKLPPGLANNGTVYQTKGRWFAANLVRFFQGNIQPVGGWVQRSLSGSMSGVPRASISFRLNNGTVCLVVGTTARLYAIVNNVVSDITPADEVSIGVRADRVWQLDVFGAWLIAVSNLETSTFSGGGMYEWHGDVTAPATTVLNGPKVAGFQVGATIRSVVCTPERFVVALGGQEPLITLPANGKSPNDRLVFWASQEGTTDWDESLTTNTAGSFPLATTGSLMCGRRVTGGTLLWTTQDLWEMTYIGGTLLYSFSQKGDNCGVISDRAVAVQDTNAIWMGDNGFFLFDGFTKPLPCDVQDYVFGNLNRNLKYLIWTMPVPAYGEVWWFYPSATASDIDRYVCFNYRENHWSFGEVSRTTGVPFQLPGNVPVMVDSAGNVYDHETGTSFSGAGTSLFLESGPFEIGEGDNVVSINRLIPDEKNLGEVNLTVFGQFRPLSPDVVYGPYAMQNEAANVRIKARQFRLQFNQVVSNPWRIGTMRFGIVQGGRR
jgi:hypothetical protein